MTDMTYDNGAPVMPPVPQLSHEFLTQAASGIRQNFPAHMWGAAFAFALGTEGDGLVQVSHAALAGLSHRHAGEFDMPEADRATIEQLLPGLQSAGFISRKR